MRRKGVGEGCSVNDGEVPYPGVGCHFEHVVVDVGGDHFNLVGESTVDGAQ
jgi:hypothetical protein